MGLFFGLFEVGRSGREARIAGCVSVCVGWVGVEQTAAVFFPLLFCRFSFGFEQDRDTLWREFGFLGGGTGGDAKQEFWLWQASLWDSGDLHAESV